MELDKSLRTCRLCGKNGSNFRAIFSEIDGMKIADKISKCLPILVSPKDKLPHHLCSLCLRSLNSSYKLLIKAIETDERLRQQLYQSRDQGTDHSNYSNRIDTHEPGICGFCEIRFADADTFDRHMETYHDSKWRCNICHNLFTASEELLQHKYKKHYEDSGLENSNNSGIDETLSASERSASNPKCPSDPVSDIVNIKEEPISAAEIFDAEPLDSENYKRRKTEEALVSVIDIKEETLPASQKFVAGPFDAARSEMKIVRVNCDICNVSIVEALMIQHKKIHEPSEVSCARCETKFSSLDDLTKHKREAHDYFSERAIKFFCKNCNRLIVDLKAQEGNHDCDKPRHKCDHCDETFEAKLLLKLHEEIHVEDDAGTEEKYRCEQCNKKFLKSTHLIDHIESVHAKFHEYECNLCSKNFSTRRTLENHKRIHVNRTCPQCKEEFEDTRSYNAHFRRAHNVIVAAQEELICKECGKKFSRWEHLRDHENIHSGKKPYICNTCYKTFRSYRARWSHERTHKREATLSCDYCQYKFWNKHSLANHIWSHLPPEDWPYECGICKFKFKRKMYLKSHERTHSKDRAYKCDVCDTQFSSKRQIVKHKKCHFQKNLVN